MDSERMPIAANQVTNQQLEALLEFLALNRELANGLLKGPEGRLRAHHLWEDLCASLNSMGGCIKTVQQWQRVWTVRKYLAKKAAAASSKAALGTGGGPSTAPDLTDNDMKVLTIMGKGYGEPQTTACVEEFPVTATVEPHVVGDFTPCPRDRSPLLRVTHGEADKSSQLHPLPAHQSPPRRRPLRNTLRRFLELEERREQREITRTNELRLLREELVTKLEVMCNELRLIREDILGSRELN